MLSADTCHLSLKKAAENPSVVPWPLLSASHLCLERSTGPLQLSHLSNVVGPHQLLTERRRTAHQVSDAGDKGILGTSLKHTPKG